MKHRKILKRMSVKLTVEEKGFDLVRRRHARFFVGTGVNGAGFGFVLGLRDVSESGGEGGVAVTAEFCEPAISGGVDAVGDGSVVADVEISETGDLGRSSSVVS